MHVMIAGGSGLIGSALTTSLCALQNDVSILSRNPAKLMELPGRASAIPWDGKSIGAWADLVDTTDVIVNLTGENLSGDGFLPSRWTKKRKTRLIQSRLNSGKVLTKAIEMANKKPAVFLQASGIGYYGTQQIKPLTEMDSPGNDFAANLCVGWEASSQPVEVLGVRRVVLRNGVVLSLKGRALPLLLLPYKLWVGGRFGNGKQVYSWIHIDDEVYAILFLIMNSQARGVFNMTSPNPVTNNEFGRTIGTLLHRPHYFPVPGFTMRIAFGEVASMVLEGQRVLPKKLVDLGYKFRFPTLNSALTDLLKDNS
jgi:uncharacterized protein (TIGR01777 family)